jgi:hypothetical protein
MAQAVIKDKVFKYNKINYFRAGSENLKLGDYGEKQTPNGKSNYLHVYDNLKLDHFTVFSAGPIEIDFEKSTKVGFNIAFPVKVVEAGVNVSYDSLKSGKVQLMKFYIKAGKQLADEINASPEMITGLKSLKKERFVNQIFVVMEAQMAKKVSSTTGLKVSTIGNIMNIEGELAGGGGNNTVVKLAAGTVFAYGLVAPNWNKPKKQATHVTTFKPDQQGIG